MSLKNLSFPIFVLLAFTIGVFSVKPTVESILQKRSELESKIAENADVMGTKQNLDSLYASRESLLGAPEGAAVYEYLPVSVSQDRVVDAFNYYAMQTGISLSGVGFVEKASPVAISDVAPDGSADESQILPVAPVPDSFTMTADISGSYEGIRSFLREVSHSGRSYMLTSFSITKSAASTNASGQPVSDSGTLSGNIVAEFFYLQQKKYHNGYKLPVFRNSEFNLEPIKEIIAKENSVPALAEPQGAGRNNPFSL
ncbi:MAG: hypothetical protein WCJ25_00525 [Candidatus Moraniibacteriota bacterium]